RRYRTWGCKRIAQQIALAFGVDIDKDVVRRILGIHFRPEAGSGGPSWLSFIGHAKDSLWSLDLFRCESAMLRTYWVLVVMDQFTRRIVGFAVHRGVVDGLALCRTFHRAIHTQTPPKYLSSDHDPLYQFHQWQANLRVLNTWTKHYSGRRPTWRKNSACFSTISIGIAHTRAWKEGCQSPVVKHRRP
ncbi:MAG TPA: DDE-type integrase/transposase/recombinase, partial [Candidatus Dormibacteraeota bacterium]|nr:DDE-type integrase/transposase/recombinase [Candidatus Dormibacteraeota bacterium]